MILFAMLSTLLFAAPALAAYNPLSGNGKACSAGGAGSTGCTAGNGATDPISGPNGLLKKVTLIISAIAGLAAVIIIIVSGFQFITAGGDAQKVASARSTLIGAIIGLVIILAARSILIFVLNRA
jgi:hypothetical protein